MITDTRPDNQKTNTEVQLLEAAVRPNQIISNQRNRIRPHGGLQQCSGSSSTAVFVGAGPVADNRPMENLFRNIPGELPEELFETLARGQGVRIERIVSKGHATPESAWYDQDDNEWVLVLKGAARLEFEDGSSTSLEEGDWLDIPAHRKHRVAWTDPSRETIWLAVHYGQV